MVRAVFAGQPAEAAAKRQAGDPGCRIDACRDREPKRLRGLVNIGERRPRIDPRPSRARVDVNRRHLREIDHQTPIADRITRDVMAAAPHRDQQTVVAGKIDGVNDVGRLSASNDKTGLPIDHRIPDDSRLVIGGCMLIKHLTLQCALKGTEPSGIDLPCAGIGGCKRQPLHRPLPRLWSGSVSDLSKREPA